MRSLTLEWTVNFITISNFNLLHTFMDFNVKI